MGIPLKIKSSNPVNKFITSNYATKRRLIGDRDIYHFCSKQKIVFYLLNVSNKKRLKAFAVAGGMLKKIVRLSQDDKKVL